METKRMGVRNLAFVLSEGNGAISYEEITIKAGLGVVEPGTVLGRVTADEQFVPADPGAANGSETAVAILAYRVDATDEDVRALALARQAEVKRPMLIFGGGFDTDAKREAAIDQLADQTIIAR